MTPRRIERFFAVLDRELGARAKVYLTGAAAGALYGRVRPSVDIDFGLELPARSAVTWESAHAAVTRTSARTGIPASAAADIDRWGMITLLEYRRTSRRHARIGRLELRLLDPANWAIGKLTRYLDPDVRDVAEVFRRQSVPARRAVRIWGRALRASPPSTTQFQFRRNVELFLRDEGPGIWGRGFDAGTAIRWFHAAAAIRPPAISPPASPRSARRSRTSRRRTTTRSRPARARR